ncbi:phosphotriesterase [Salmonella enterica subsp. enterica serovar Typhimurium]|nr:phosphotriesterase [Salmonella enterica subsp. enterica serovar Typhimurium]
MKGFLQTVTGPVAHTDMGLTLPHEHLFNDLSSVVRRATLCFFTATGGKESQC